MRSYKSLSLRQKETNTKSDFLAVFPIEHYFILSLSFISAFQDSDSPRDDYVDRNKNKRILLTRFIYQNLNCKKILLLFIRLIHQTYQVYYG